MNRDLENQIINERKKEYEQRCCCKYLVLLIGFIVMCILSLNCLTLIDQMGLCWETISFTVLCFVLWICECCVCPMAMIEAD